MTTQLSHSYYASLHVEGEILVAKFEDILDRELGDQEWLQEARASVEDWLKEHLSLLERPPLKAQLFRGERVFEFDLAELARAQDQAKKKSIHLGPGENLIH